MSSFPPAGARPSRRAVLAGGLLLAGTLAGCGDPREDTGTTAPAAGFPRRVDTALGPVEISAKPQRIVTLGREAEVVLALDVTPVGMPKSYYAPGVEPYLEDRIAGRDVTVFDTADGIPFVLLMAHISPSVQAQLESLPVFAAVPAVREGRYVPVDLITVSVLRSPMVLGIERALDRLVPELERALG